MQSQSLLSGNTMNNLLEPLTEDELAELDHFLLDHVVDEDGDVGDDGVASVFELDGLFTALVSSPTLVKPEQWMPEVWGETEPEWDSEDQFDRVVALMMRHLNTMAATLQEAPEEFDPLFMQDEEDGEEFVVVDDWCEGYVKGVKLAMAQWRAGGNEVERLLNPIRAFTSVTQWRGHELSEAETDKLSDAIAPSARGLYAFWAGQRQAG